MSLDVLDFSLVISDVTRLPGGNKGLDLIKSERSEGTGVLLMKLYSRQMKAQLREHGVELRAFPASQFHLDICEKCCFLCSFAV